MDQSIECLRSECSSIYAARQFCGIQPTPQTPQRDGRGHPVADADFPHRRKKPQRLARQPLQHQGLQGSEPRLRHQEGFCKVGEGNPQTTPYIETPGSATDAPPGLENNATGGMPPTAPTDPSMAPTDPSMANSPYPGQPGQPGDGTDVYGIPLTAV